MTSLLARCGACLLALGYLSLTSWGGATASDKKDYSVAFEAARKGEWKIVLRLMDRGPNPQVNAYLRHLCNTSLHCERTWRQLLADAQISSRLPNQERWQKHTEEALYAAMTDPYTLPDGAFTNVVKSSTDPEDDPPSPLSLQSWFASHKPMGPSGALADLAADLAMGMKSPEEMGAKARRYWHRHPFNEEQENWLLSRFGRHITPKDHEVRLARMVTQNHVAAAERQLHRVNNRVAQRDRLRLQLRQSSGSMESLTPSLRRYALDPLVALDRLWRMHEEKKTVQVAQNIAHIALLLRKNPRPAGWDEQLWRRIQMETARALMGRKHFRLASGSLVSLESEPIALLSAWLRLRRLDDPLNAHKILADLNVEKSASRTKAAVHYWRARAAMELGYANESREALQRSAEEGTFFHAQLAGAMLSRNAAQAVPITPTPKIERIRAFATTGLPALALDLHQLGQSVHAGAVLSHMGKTASSYQDKLLASALAHAVGQASVGVHLARRAAQQGYTAMQTAYPAIDLPVRPWDHSLVLAVMRQESGFNHRAVSRSGARGLMQLIPTTAAYVAKLNGIPYNKARLLTDPDYNVTLGNNYLERMLARYNGATYLALSAYNGGPTNTDKWLALNGNPGHDILAIIDWIEAIPANETRHYVRKVLEAHSIYERLSRRQTAMTPVFFTSLGRMGVSYAR